jgi:AcrR family transcriptional regulator
MPRVSEAHLAARRQQILDAARTCFLRNGFHATSMQDVIAEAELSVGAVYRYFRSKDEIVAAIAEQYSGEINRQLAQLTVGPARPLAFSIQKAVDLVDANVGPDGVMRLAVVLWAEALRDKTVAAAVERAYSMLRENFVRLAKRAIERGELPPNAEPGATGAALYSLIAGYGLQRLLTGQPNKQAYKRAVRALLTRPPTA